MKIDPFIDIEHFHPVRLTVRQIRYSYFEGCWGKRRIKSLPSRPGLLMSLIAAVQHAHTSTLSILSLSINAHCGCQLWQTLNIRVARVEGPTSEGGGPAP